MSATWNGWYDIGYPASHIAWHDRDGLRVWPDGARMAVLLYTAPEEWVWDRTPQLRPGPAYMQPGAPVLAERSIISYGFNIGLRRQARVFADFGTKVTMWTCGAAIEQHPEAIAELAAAGHEIAGHGYDEGQWMAQLSRAEQEESIHKTAALIEEVTGAPMRGWICPGALCNSDTIELLAAAGVEYDADLQDDELPYYITAGGREMLVIPYRMIGNFNDQMIFGRDGRNSVEGALDHLKQAFDSHYREAERVPQIFNYGTHPFVSGRPDTADVLARFLEYVHGHADVWVTNYAAMTDWWNSSFASRTGSGPLDVSALPRA